MQALHTNSVRHTSFPRSPWECIPNFATRASEEADHRFDPSTASRSGRTRRLIASCDSAHLIAARPEPFDKLRTGVEERACRRMQALHTNSVRHTSFPQSRWECIPNFSAGAFEIALTLRLLRAQGERENR